MSFAVVALNIAMVCGLVVSLRSALDPQRARRAPLLGSFTRNGKRFQNKSDRFVVRLCLAEAAIYAVFLVAGDLVLLLPN